MAVRIRLKRRGRKKMAMYDIIVADARAPRDGKFIEKLGLYNPNTDPATIELNADRAFDWVMDGAQPSDTARSILSYKGVMIKKHLQVGVNKGAITQEEADKKYAEWMKTKEAKIQAKIDGLAKDKAASDKSIFEAEVKVKEARAEALLKKQSEMIAAEEAAAKAKAAEEAGEEAAEEAPVADEVEVTGTEATEESPAKEAKPEAAKEEVAEVKEEAKEEAPVEETTKEEASPATEAKDEKVEEPVAETTEEVKEEVPAKAEAKDETSADEPAEEATKDEEKKED